MKSRTLSSFCQRPGLNPSHGEVSFRAAASLETVVVIVVLLPLRLALKFSSQPEQRPSVPGYHQLLVGRDDPRRDLALSCGDSWAARLIRLGVEFHAQPARSVADAPADLGRVLADACGEDQP